MINVSIIVPVYNAEKYLRTCIESIINQSLKEIEIILINDGSTDNSLNICKEYANKDNRIKLINKANEGVSIARNIGMEKAIGKYLTFIDADDYIDADMIRCMNERIINDMSELCICNYIREDNNEKNIVRCGIDKKILNYSEILNEFLIPMIGRDCNDNKEVLSNFRAPWGKLYCTDIIKKYNLKFDKELVIGEDFIFILEYLKYVNKISLENQAFYHYMINESSATRKYKNDPWNLIYKKTIIRLEDYLKENNIYIQSKERVDNLIFKYFNICMANEYKSINKKSHKEIIKSIRSMINDEYIKRALHNISSKNYSFKDKLMLEGARFKSSILIYMIGIVKYK